MELIKDYDVALQYHMSKSNTTGNALSRKRTTKSQVAIIRCLLWYLFDEISEFNLYKEVTRALFYLSATIVEASLVERVL